MSNKRIQKKHKSIDYIIRQQKGVYYGSDSKTDDFPTKGLFYYVKPTAEYSKYDSRKLHWSD